MAFNISEFRATIGGQLANPARFRAMIPAPGLDTEDTRVLAILCNQAQLPARQFTTIDYTTHGPVMKMPYQNMYDDVVMSFYCRENMGIKELFQNWQNIVCDNNRDSQFRYLDEYKTNITIEQFGADGKSNYAVTLVDAYPLMVSPLQMDWATQNAFHNLQITFAYRYWKEEDEQMVADSLSMNDLYPKVDVSAMASTGVALFSNRDGQAMSKIQQNINNIFGKNRTQPLTALQNSTALQVNKQIQNFFNDRFMLHE